MPRRVVVYHFHDCMAVVGDIVGRYQLLGKLGEGAMGAVWRAKHTTLGTSVAVKLIHAGAALNPNARARFEREAILSARLKSAHVVQVIDHGHHNNLPFIAMELLEGQSLADRLQQRGRLSVAETAMVVKHVCRALGKAHELGLVHRDVKPANLMVCPGEDEGEEIVKVLDFGIAKVTDELGLDGIIATRTGALMGTPFYLSPEQAKGLKTVGPASDLWSVSVVAFECLTGQRPFVGHAMGPLIAKIIHEPLPVPSRVAPEARLTPEIDAWMNKALQREPSHRFASAKELAQSFTIAAGLSDSLSGRSDTSLQTAPTLVFDGNNTDSDLAKTAILDGGATLALDGHSVSPPVGPGASPAARVAPAPRGADQPIAAASMLQADWPAAQQRSSRLPLVIGVVVVTLLAVGGAGWWLMRGAPSPPPSNSAAPSVTGGSATDDSDGEESARMPVEQPEPDTLDDDGAPPAPGPTGGKEGSPSPKSAPKPAPPPSARPPASVPAPVQPPPAASYRRTL